VLRKVLVKYLRVAASLLCLTNYIFQDPHPKGEVFVGSAEKNFKICVGSSPTVKDPGFGFALHTPERTFHFSADSEQERKEWIDVIQFVISSPLSPQDSKIFYRSSSI